MVVSAKNRDSSMRRRFFRQDFMSMTDFRNSRGMRVSRYSDPNNRITRDDIMPVFYFSFLPTNHEGVRTGTSFAASVFDGRVNVCTYPIGTGKTQELIIR